MVAALSCGTRKLLNLKQFQSFAEITAQQSIESIESIVKMLIIIVDNRISVKNPIKISNPILVQYFCLLIS